MATNDKVIFKMLANIYLLRKSINTNFTIILMPLSLTLHNYDKFLWYKSYVPSKYIYYTHLAEVLHSITPTSRVLESSCFLFLIQMSDTWKLTHQRLKTTHVNQDFLSNFWVFLSLSRSFFFSLCPFLLSFCPSQTSSRSPENQRRQDRYFLEKKEVKVDEKIKEE